MQGLLTPECLHAEFQIEKASTESTALNPAVEAACQQALQTSCKMADPAAALRCLEDRALAPLAASASSSSSSSSSSLSSSGDGDTNSNDRADAPLTATTEEASFAACRAEVKKVIKLKNEDYRLSPLLQETCSADAERLCPIQKKAVDGSEELGGGLGHRMPHRPPRGDQGRRLRGVGAAEDGPARHRRRQRPAARRRL